MDDDSPEEARNNFIRDSRTNEPRKYLTFVIALVESNRTTVDPRVEERWANRTRITRSTA